MRMYRMIYENIRTGEHKSVVSSSKVVSPGWRLVSVCGYYDA